MSTNLTQTRLVDLLHYSPETGEFTWRVSARKGRVKAGDRAGHLAACGYRTIRVEGVLLRAARLACLYMTGSWPEEVVDHVNGDRGDDRWENLRMCSELENQENVTANSRTGRPLGAHYHSHSGLWRARIKRGGTTTSLGYYRTATEAHRAYLEAKAKVHKFQPTPRAQM